ncbi:MAG: hypothetical protein ABI629_07965, partial [bacterium]
RGVFQRGPWWGRWRMATQGAARLSLAALPSITLKDAAAQWGCSVAQLGEFIRTGLLTCHVLLHDVVVVTQAGWRTHTKTVKPTTRTLTGHYRVPIASAVRGLSGNPCLAGFNTVVETEPDRTIALPFALGLESMRILRDEAERFEREVLARGPVAPARTPGLKTMQEHRIACRAIARLLWKQDAAVPIRQMARRDEIITYGCNGTVYGEETVASWLKDLSPGEHKPGRPKKTPETKIVRK